MRLAPLAGSTLESDRSSGCIHTRMTARRFSDQLKPERMAPRSHEGAMKKTRFTEEQMVAILREADAKPVPEVAKKHGVAAATTTPGGSISAAWSRAMFGEFGSSSKRMAGSRSLLPTSRSTSTC